MRLVSLMRWLARHTRGGHRGAPRDTEGHRRAQRDHIEITEGAEGVQKRGTRDDMDGAPRVTDGDRGAQRDTDGYKGAPMRTQKGREGRCLHEMHSAESSPKGQERLHDQE